MIDWDAMVTGPCVDVFGEDVDYTPAGGATATIQLVYDEGNRDIVLADGTSFNQSHPIVSGSLSAFPVAPQQGDTLVICRTGEAFEVKDVNQDGKGSVALPLNFMGAT